VEVSNSDRFHRGLQYIFNLRMGDIFESANGRLFHGCPIRCSECLPWSDSRMVRSLDREAFLMRAHKVVNYESILQVLGEAGCPFCRFMKNVQTALLQEPGREIHQLCNFHTWGLAATQEAVSAAEHFMALLQDRSGGIPSSSCTICTLLQEEEDFRIREFISYTEHKLVAQWLRSQAVLCTVHGAKLRQGAPPVVVATVNAIMERCRRQLVEDLRRLQSEYLADAERWGVLGRAAEFMVSQRGLHA